MTTQQTQDYLKAIYELASDHKTVSTTALAEHLFLTPASVTGMLKRLAVQKPALVRYKKHQGVQLTSLGEKMALQILRQHRLLETYLVEALGYSWDEVHEEACRLEHAISEQFENRIDAVLGRPQRDPHGDPIPSSNLEIPMDRSRPLSEFRPPQKAVICRVNGKDPALLRRLDKLGMIPGASITIVDYSELDQVLSIRIGTREPTCSVGSTISRQVLAEELLEPPAGDSQPS
ncbi:MAG: metal-dependent transcriptional regulator [Anaerolineales bacterium]|nr:metal-dependent transcriptional regulator [Anaerolineales bacterium]